LKNYDAAWLAAIAKNGLLNELIQFDNR
jgi:hypothetical protein